MSVPPITHRPGAPCTRCGGPTIESETLVSARYDVFRRHISRFGEEYISLSSEVVGWSPVVVLTCVRCDAPEQQAPE